ncbi:hypothetical protein J4E90_000467 [Alternaria incomplexa]|uniref:uncharacterized protein n=1 Tax=Alternaria incomplexa TaxID=1187928 RepID=UPI00221E80F3|nr:uncharacterized protein J4E90_000467 [Alternaria incomplexa]KAI4922039.1 hypothetical protein J4E90_000467 [Alternaria incomplexa]
MAPKKGQDNKKPAQTPARTATEVYDEGENNFSTDVYASLIEDEISSVDEDIAPQYPTGPTTYQESDELWQQAAKGERAIKLPVGANMPKWLNIEESQLGAAAITTYVSYLDANQVQHQEIWLANSKNDHSTKTPPCWVEFDKDNHVNRIVFSVPHPEYFNRYRGTVVTHTMRANALKERLMDFAMVKTTTGIILRMSDFEDYGEDNETLRTVLSIPNLRNSTLNVLLTGYKKITKEEVEGIKAMRKTMDVELTEKPSHWDRADVISKYGHHAFTFKLIAERREGPRQSTEPKTQPLALSLYEIDGNTFLKRYNTTVADLLAKEEIKKQKACVRRKKRRAVEMEGEDKENAEDSYQTPNLTPLRKRVASI